MDFFTGLRDVGATRLGINTDIDESCLENTEKKKITNKCIIQMITK